MPLEHEKAVELDSSSSSFGFNLQWQCSHVGIYYHLNQLQFLDVKLREKGNQLHSDWHSTEAEQGICICVHKLINTNMYVAAADYSYITNN